MAISTETEALIDLYTQKIALDTNQLSQIDTLASGYTITTGVGATETIKVWGPQEVVDNYNVSITKIDNEIIQLNQQISEIQNKIYILGYGANQIGCGTMTWSVGYTTHIVYADILNYRGYALNFPNNVFDEISGTLNINNSGIGTFNYITQVAIGTYYEPITTCNNLFTCTTQLCAGYATSIAELESQLPPLQSNRDNLIEKVNFMKFAKVEPELQVSALDQSKTQLNSSIATSNTILTFLQDPANEEWL